MAQHFQRMTGLPAVAVLALFCTATTALAHDVRHPDGTPWVHEHATRQLPAASIRNVSPVTPQFTSCDKATWPDIPASCLTRPAVAAVKLNSTPAGKAGRVTVTLVAGNFSN